MTWLNDEAFIRDRVPMTKESIRILVMGHMNISKGDKFLDVGSGTGSISIQAALLGANVTSIEQKELGVNLLEENAKKHGVKVKAISGRAPEDLPDETFNKIFIGGSTGALDGIFDFAESHMAQGGILAATFITLDNIVTCKNLLEEYGYEDVEVLLIQTAKMDRLGLMRGENPIYLLKGVKA